MTAVAYIPLPREDVVSYLGQAWPAPSDATVLRVDPEQGVTDGAVTIASEFPGMPGILWWLIDGVIPPQSVGPVTEALAAQIPGSVLVVPPEPPEPSPPYTVD